MTALVADDVDVASAEALRRELLGVIEHAAATSPRSLQARIGPSELGSPCLRRIGHRLAGTPEVNTGADRWAATIGTAVHAWLAEVFDLLDPPGTPPGGRRWLAEERVGTGVVAGDGVDGTCDLFDRRSGTVVDWKVVGVAGLRNYRTLGPGEQYRVQAHCYGFGWAARGEQVRRVGVMFLPRGGSLRDAHLWTEPYDPAVAVAAHLRAGHIAVAVRGDREALGLLPTADAFCSRCPWWQPGASDLTRACPGDASATEARRAAATAPLESLIA